MWRSAVRGSEKLMGRMGDGFDSLSTMTIDVPHDVHTCKMYSGLRGDYTINSISTGEMN